MKPIKFGSLSSKTAQSLTLIRQAVQESGAEIIAVGFSGGKDSSVVLDLVRQVVPDAIPVFCNTGVEWKETVDYCRTIPGLVELHPDKTFWQCVDEYGLPQIKGKNAERANNCCDWLKDKPMKAWIKASGCGLVFTGITARESHARAMFLYSDTPGRGPLAYVQRWKVWKCHPIFNWKVKEVWQYIRDRDLPHNVKYSQGIRRIGCRPCTAYINWRGRLAVEDRKMYNVLVSKYGIGKMYKSTNLEPWVSNEDLAPCDPRAPKEASG